MTLTNNITHSHDNKFILKESIEEKLYQIIRSEIRKGDLKQGTILVQGTLADKYGVSRIPVRSALQLLEKELFTLAITLVDQYFVNIKP